MRALIQKCSKAQVDVNGKLGEELGNSLVVFVGVGVHDSEDEADWILKKVLGMRLFSDEDGKMNWDLEKAQGSLVIVSQFTLYASTKKGNRPSFLGAAPPQKAEELFNYFVQQAREQFTGKMGLGKFGAHMDVKMVNDGPVSIWLDTENKE